VFSLAPIQVCQPVLNELTDTVVRWFVGGCTGIRSVLERVPKRMGLNVDSQSFCHFHTPGILNRSEYYNIIINKRKRFFLPFFLFWLQPKVFPSLTKKKKKNAAGKSKTKWLKHDGVVYVRWILPVRHACNANSVAQRSGIPVGAT